MKKLLILALDTFTHDQVFSWPMKHLDAKVEVYGGQKAPDVAIMWAVKQHQPDVVVWSGVCGGEDMPTESFLRSVRWPGCRSVMICWDAGHKDWWPYLEQYKKAETFDAIFAVDGSDTPWCESFLCPINPEWYDGYAPGEKPIDLGFMGSFDSDSVRGRVLAELGNLVTVRRRTGEPGAYKEYADFILRCRATVNVAGCAGDVGQHVKARCVEAAWAGCMLFEPFDSPLSRWVPQRCYWGYRDVESIRTGLMTQDAAEYGQRLREAMQSHHPKNFWQRVMGN